MLTSLGTNRNPIILSPSQSKEATESYQQTDSSFFFSYFVNLSAGAIVPPESRSAHLIAADKCRMEGAVCAQGPLGDATSGMVVVHVCHFSKLNIVYLMACPEKSLVAGGVLLLSLCCGSGDQHPATEDRAMVFNLRVTTPKVE